MFSETRIQHFFYTARSLYRKVSPFSSVRDSDLPFDESALNEELKAQGFTLEEYRIDLDDFSRWKRSTLALYPSAYRTGYGSYFEEKCLEHYLSLQLAPIGEESVVIDVANAGSPFPHVASALGATVYQNDLIFPPGARRIGERIHEVGGTACDMPLPDNFADLMVLHCAFEMFEGAQDGLLIREARRVLKPSGTMVVVPLYLSATHHIFCDLGVSRAGCHYDEGAKIIYSPGFHGARFARFYDADALRRRVLHHSHGLEMKILYCCNVEELSPDRSTLYLRYVGLFQKH
ncbi:MAG: methyltransferase domain-containing protein [Desulfobacteraceae bacterium]|nr:MAG: methyltransferase domain-containing protein [Desulfobacteraceae bacterium]